jgi:microcystin-dependent protein
MYTPSVQANNVQMNPFATSIAGGNLPHNNMAPFLGLMFIIALQGVFPARS